jgi:hypothetical protein
MINRLNQKAYDIITFCNTQYINNNYTTTTYCKLKVLRCFYSKPFFVLNHVYITCTTVHYIIWIKVAVHNNIEKHLALINRCQETFEFWITEDKGSPLEPEPEPRNIFPSGNIKLTVWVSSHR